MAQGSELDFAAGPVVRDLRLVSDTKRVGGEIQFAAAHRFMGKASLGIAASFYGFSGPGNITLHSPAVGGLFGPAGEFVLRWDFKASRGGPFTELGIGRLWVSEGNNSEPWFDIVSGGIGYRRWLGGSTSVFAEVEYERLSGSRPAPKMVRAGTRWNALVIQSIGLGEADQYNTPIHTTRENMVEKCDSTVFRNLERSRDGVFALLGLHGSSGRTMQ